MTMNSKLSAAEKRRIVLDGIRSGKTFAVAYAAAGLSEYGNNPATYLLRLVENGYLELSVPTNHTP